MAHSCEVPVLVFAPEPHHNLLSIWIVVDLSHFTFDRNRVAFFDRSQEFEADFAGLVKHVRTKKPAKGL